MLRLCFIKQLGVKMRLVKADIKNFRKLKDCSLSFSSDQTILVGANNSGKTSAMKVLKLFLKNESSNEGFKYTDFTFDNWVELNKKAQCWFDKTVVMNPEEELQEWKNFCPSLDLIINVESSEIHHVIEFLPSLDWDGGLIGLRLRLEPKNIEELRNDFVELCNENKRVMSENGQIAISNFWPNENIQEFLSRHLDKYFRIKSYVIDPYAENTEEILLETSEPLKGLIKINVIGEDAGFFNSNGAKNLLSSIIQSFYKSHFDNRRVCIGTSPLANGAKVMIDPDRLFGRHLAVLGNTGSGKSCSVAGLIRWSLDAAEKVRHSQPNARFIILDPNGEYSETFKDKENVRIFSVEPKDEDIQQLQVPLWLWNSSEWVSFTQASPKTQRPTLIQALRSVREGVFNIEQSAHQEMKQYLRTLISITQIEINSGSPWGNFPKPKNFFEKLKKWKIGITDQDVFDSNQQTCLTEIIDKITHFEQARSAQYAQFDFERTEINDFLQLLKIAYTSFGGSAMDALPIDADIPRPFSGENLLKSIEGNAELLGVSEYIDTMQMRIKTLLSDTRMKVLTSQIDGAEEMSLDGWLSNYIGDNNSSNGTVTVIDLSLVPAEISHIIAATIARMTLESLQRYRRMNHGQVLPTVLVMEEAHTFVKRYKDDVEHQNSSSICCQVFEKIAREGRKFGLGMMLSSQRPSELSPTVLSQCNSFLLHRISNERDQELIHKLVPDNLRGLLRDLPSLPSRNAILLGWASELPVLVQMNHLSAEHRPRSDDPDYWNVWTGQDHEGKPVNREVNWKEIADDWQQI